MGALDFYFIKAKLINRKKIEPQHHYDKAYVGVKKWKNAKFE